MIFVNLSGTSSESRRKSLQTGGFTAGFTRVEDWERTPLQFRFKLFQQPPHLSRRRAARRRSGPSGPSDQSARGQPGPSARATPPLSTTSPKTSMLEGGGGRIGVRSPRLRGKAKGERASPRMPHPHSPLQAKERGRQGLECPDHRGFRSSGAGEVWLYPLELECTQCMGVREKCTPKAVSVCSGAPTTICFWGMLRMQVRRQRVQT